MAYAARPRVSEVLRAPQPTVGGTRPGFYVTPDGVVVPSTAYRAIGGSAVNDARTTGVIEPRNPTYFTFDNILEMPPGYVQNLLQLSRTPSHVATFDTLQIMPDIRTPTANWNRGTVPEPFAVSNPQWGTGGGSQGITALSIQGFSLSPLPGVNAPPQFATTTLSASR